MNSIKSSEALHLAPKECWIGNQSLLSNPTAAILNSRQNRYPVGDELWVKQTITAAAWLVQKKMTLLTGIGMKTWELALWAMNEAMGSVIVLVGSPMNTGDSEIRPRLQQVIEDFKLERQFALLIPYYESNRRTGKPEWQARDQWIMQRAEVLLPISWRPNSSLQQYIEKNNLQLKLETRFQVRYSPRSYSFKRAVTADSAIEALSGVAWNHLVHWTRISPIPWIGERPADYYRAIVSSSGEYPRSAFHTLKHILQEKKIRGTCWRMPNSSPMVSFTSLHPVEMIEKMTWRRRYVRPSFEPYGIAVKISECERLGVKPVCYGNVKERKILSKEERRFFQTLSSKGADWSRECEWRMAGDFDLSKVDPEAMMILVPSQEEKVELENIFAPLRLCAIALIANYRLLTTR